MHEHGLASVSSTLMQCCLNDIDHMALSFIVFSVFISRGMLVIRAYVVMLQSAHPIIKNKG